MTDGRDTLRRAAELGGFFAVDVELGEVSDPVGWQPFSALLTAEGPALRAGVQRARVTLAARSQVEPAELDSRVAPSLWFLGWAARLVSPWLGAAALTGGVPTLPTRPTRPTRPTESVRWREGPGQPVPLRIVGAIEATRSGSGPDELAHAVHEHCVRPFVEPLLDATAAAYSLSSQVLWGNVASALAGAAATVGTARPDCAGAAQAVVVELLGIGSLRERGAFVARQFRRQSCCLIYRLPGAGLCADCVLVGA